MRLQSAHGIVARPLVALFLFLPLGAARSQDQPRAPSPAEWAVAGVASNDVLNMRDVPSGDAKVIARIPPDARGLKALGCLKKQISLDDWMVQSKEQRRDAQLLWCRVRYADQEGWVAGRFLKPN